MKYSLALRPHHRRPAVSYGRSVRTVRRRYAYFLMFLAHVFTRFSQFRGTKKAKASEPAKKGK